MHRSTLAAAALAALTLVCALPGAAEEDPAVAGSPAANEEIVRRYTAEVYNEQKLDAIPSYVSELFVDHSPGNPPGPHGTAHVRAQAEQSFAGMPDLHFAIEHLFAEDDMVAMHWRAQGTASATFGGGGSTGRKIDVEGISLFRIEGGKIVESWDIVDRLTLFQQAGFRMMPPTAFRSEPEEPQPEPQPEPSPPADGASDAGDAADAGTPPAGS